MFNILIIDDEEIIRFSLGSLLEDEGFNIFEAENASQGIDISQKEEIHLAIVDIHIPGMDGSDLILKINEIKPQIKILIHTGDGNYTIPHKLESIGLLKNQILLKPIIDFNLLTNKIKRLLK